jgi:hypothetical protein
MDRALLQRHLAKAKRRVDEDQLRVHAQARIVAELRQGGHDTVAAERLLAAMQDSSRLHMAQLAELCASMDAITHP